MKVSTGKVCRLFLMGLVMKAALIRAQPAFYREGITEEKAIRRPVACGEFLFVNCSSSEAAEAGLSVLYRYDLAGNSKRMVHDKYLWSLHATLDNRLVSLAQERRCSYRLDTLSFFIQKLDTNGNVVSTHTLQNGASVIVETADTGYIAFLWDNKTLVSFDKDLNFVSQKTHTLGMVLGGVLCKNGEIALTHNAGSASRFSMMDGQAQVLFTKNATVPANDLRLMGNDRITAYANNVFSVVDYSLNPVSSKPVKFIYDYFINNDSVFVIMPDSIPSQVIYAVLNSSLNVVYKTIINNYFPLAIANLKNSAAILYEPTSVISKGWRGHYLSVSPKLSGLNPGKEMIIQSVTVDSTFIVTRGDGFYDVYARLNYKVSNFGTPVNRFTVSVELDGDKLCGKYFSKQQISASLPFAGSYSGKSDGFLKKEGVLHNGFVTVEYCVVLGRPNDEFDNQPGSNLWCLNVAFDPTALRESSGPLPVTVFPNPADNEVTVKCDSEIERVEVMNVLGQVISTTVPAMRETIVDVSLLQPGIYLLSVQSGAQQAIKKVVVD